MIRCKERGNSSQIIKRGNYHDSVHSVTMPPTGRRPAGSTTGSGAAAKVGHWNDDDKDMVPPIELDQTVQNAAESPTDVNSVGQTGFVQVGGQRFYGYFGRWTRRYSGDCCQERKDIRS